MSGLSGGVGYCNNYVFYVAAFSVARGCYCIILWSLYKGKFDERMAPGFKYQFYTMRQINKLWCYHYSWFGLGYRLFGINKEMVVHTQLMFQHSFSA